MQKCVYILSYLSTSIFYFCLKYIPYLFIFQLHHVYVYFRINHNYKLYNTTS